MSAERVKVTPAWWGGHVQFESGGGGDPSDGCGVTTAPLPVFGTRRRVERKALRMLARRARDAGAYTLCLAPPESESGAP